MTDHRLFGVITALARLTHLSGKTISPLPTRIVVASVLILLVASLLTMTVLLSVLLSALAALGTLSLLPLRRLRSRLLYNLGSAGNTGLLR